MVDFVPKYIEPGINALSSPVLKNKMSTTVIDIYLRTPQS